MRGNLVSNGAGAKIRAALAEPNRMGSRTPRAPPSSERSRRHGVPSSVHVRPMSGLLQPRPPPGGTHRDAAVRTPPPNGLPRHHLRPSFSPAPRHPTRLGVVAAASASAHDADQTELESQPTRLPGGREGKSRHTRDGGVVGGWPRGMVNSAAIPKSRSLLSAGTKSPCRGTTRCPSLVDPVTHTHAGSPDAPFQVAQRPPKRGGSRGRQATTRKKRGGCEGHKLDADLGWADPARRSRKARRVAAEGARICHANPQPARPHTS